MCGVIQVPDNDSIFYTVIDPDTEAETRMNIGIEPDRVEINGVVFDLQQLAEFGSLLVAMARGKYDADSCEAVIEGYWG